MEALKWFYYLATSGYSNGWISLSQHMLVVNSICFINQSVKLHRSLQFRNMVSWSWLFGYWFFTFDELVIGSDSELLSIFGDGENSQENNVFACSQMLSVSAILSPSIFCPDVIRVNVYLSFYNSFFPRFIISFRSCKNYFSSLWKFFNPFVVVVCFSSLSTLELFLIS